MDRPQGHVRAKNPLVAKRMLQLIPQRYLAVILLTLVFRSLDIGVGASIPDDEFNPDLLYLRVDSCFTGVKLSRETVKDRKWYYRCALLYHPDKDKNNAPIMVVINNMRDCVRDGRLSCPNVEGFGQRSGGTSSSNKGNQDTYESWSGAGTKKPANRCFEDPPSNFSEVNKYVLMIVLWIFGDDSRCEDFPEVKMRVAAFMHVVVIPYVETLILEVIRYYLATWAAGKRWRGYRTITRLMLGVAFRVVHALLGVNVMFQPLFLAIGYMTDSGLHIHVLYNFIIFVNVHMMPSWPETMRQLTISLSGYLVNLLFITALILFMLSIIRLIRKGVNCGEIIEDTVGLLLLLHAGLSLSFLTGFYSMWVNFAIMDLVYACSGIFWLVWDLIDLIFTLEQVAWLFELYTFLVFIYFIYGCILLWFMRGCVWFYYSWKEDVVGCHMTNTPVWVALPWAISDFLTKGSHGYSKQFRRCKSLTLRRSRNIAVNTFAADHASALGFLNAPVYAGIRALIGQPNIEFDEIAAMYEIAYEQNVRRPYFLGLPPGQPPSPTMLAGFSDQVAIQITLMRRAHAAGQPGNVNGTDEDWRYENQLPYHPIDAMKNDLMGNTTSTASGMEFSSIFARRLKISPQFYSEMAHAACLSLESEGRDLINQILSELPSNRVGTKLVQNVFTMREAAEIRSFLLFLRSNGPCCALFKIAWQLAYICPANKPVESLSLLLRQKTADCYGSAGYEDTVDLVSRTVCALRATGF
nr:hypothetical protein [Tolivirales sp.]